MSALRLTLAVIAGAAATLIAYSAAFVRGDLGGVFAYLHARAALRHLRQAATPDGVAVAAAQVHLRELGQRVADPELATRLLPLLLLLGAAVGALAWMAFGRQARGEARPDVYERMVFRLAHRRGGRFTHRDLLEHSPLDERQAQAVTARLLERGRLERRGEEYHLT